MSILRRANESQQSDWLPVPEGMWRWRVGKPELLPPDKYGYRVKFPLVLTDDEKQRLEEEVGETPAGWQQSWRSRYQCGLSLGFMKAGEYKSTKLVDFLAACFGSANQRQFRQWIASGGGPKKGQTEQEELDNIAEWLGWVEDLEVYGSIRHEPDSKDPNKTWDRFAGPLAVGSLPGQKDDAYQAIGRGKLRAMIAESGPVTEAEAAPRTQPTAAQPKAPLRYEDVFADDEPQPLPFDQPAAAA